MSKVLEQLPVEWQERVKETLKAFDRVNVVYENGEYSASTGVMLKHSYAPDHKVLGWVYADEVFTEDERIENYINTFFSYPMGYKGNRDYSLMRKMQDEKVVEEDAVIQWYGKLNENGDFELVDKVSVPLTTSKECDLILDTSVYNQLEEEN